MEVTGHTGSFRIGARRAATLPTWRLTVTADGAELRATVADVDAYWIAQRPLTVALDVNDGQWVWRDVHAVTVTGAGVTALLPGQPQGD